MNPKEESATPAHTMLDVRRTTFARDRNMPCTLRVSSDL
jgi:hypothetical protein